MTNATENKEAHPSREEVIETLIDIFVETVGWIDRKDVSRTKDIVTDLGVYDDDITAFVIIAERHFNIRRKTTQADWDKMTKTTIEAIADLVLECFSRPEPPPTPAPKGLLARFWNWFRL